MSFDTFTTAMIGAMIGVWAPITAAYLMDRAAALVARKRQKAGR